MKIIGVHAKARSGKDILCTALASTYGFKHVAFADYVKEMTAKYFNIDNDKIFHKKTKESRILLQATGNAVRKIHSYYKDFGGETQEGDYPAWAKAIAVQEYGIEYIDLSSRKKKVHETLKSIVRLFTENKIQFESLAQGDSSMIWVNYLFRQMEEHDKVTYIVSDVRYRNEKEAIRACGGKVIKLIRTDRPDIEAGADHPSETELDNDTDWDFTIVNDQKKDWQQRLIVNAANAIRKFKNENLFDPEDIAKFKIDLDLHV